MIAAEDFTLAPEPAPAEPAPIAAAPGTLDLRHGDCMDLMREFPDKHFDLAIVDPPYGIGASEMVFSKSEKNQQWRPGKKWDESIPDEKYFAELFRVSKYAIVWGANYMTDYLDQSKCWIFWDKGLDGACDHGDGELAWSNMGKVIRKAPIKYAGFIGRDVERIHPTQKPVALYRWLLENYAKPGQRILDTHLGSGSHAIACHYFGAHLTASELDADYYAAACARIARETAQTTLFPA